MGKTWKRNSDDFERKLRRVKKGSKPNRYEKPILNDEEETGLFERRELDRSSSGDVEEAED